MLQVPPCSVMRNFGSSGCQSLNVPARKIFFLPVVSGLKTNTTPSAVRFGPGVVGCAAGAAGAVGSAGAAGAGSAVGAAGAAADCAGGAPPQAATASANSGARRSDEVMRLSCVLPRYYANVGQRVGWSARQA